MILVIDMNWKTGSLAYYEFVSPIVLAVEPVERCEVKHFLKVNPDEVENYSKIILSGTTLKDHATLQQPECFDWVKTCSKPILGICAGMQTISLVYGEMLNACLQVGLTEITTLKTNPLFQGSFKAYTLHNFSVDPSDQFDVLAKSSKCVQAVKLKQREVYGVLFHPEVRNQDILHRFVRSDF